MAIKLRAGAQHSLSDEMMMCANNKILFGGGFATNLFTTSRNPIYCIYLSRVTCNEGPTIFIWVHIKYNRETRLGNQKVREYISFPLSPCQQQNNIVYLLRANI